MDGKQMNCAVICCDTFRCDLIDNPEIDTPNLSSLAQRSLVFEEAFAEGLPTIQARRTMFTGIKSYPWRFEMDSRGLWPCIPGWHRVPSEQTVLAEHLYDRKIVTGLVGDTYHMFKPTQNFTRGFCSWDFIRGQEGDPVRSGPLSAIDISPYHPDGENDLKYHLSLTQYLLNMLDRHTEEDYLTPRVFRSACRWLDNNRENDPWFLWIDSFAPHERWDPPMHFADAYCEPGKSRDYIQPQFINDRDPSEEEIARTRALYYGYVTFIDKWIGRFIDKLDEMGLRENTVIIFTSDHGTELWDKKRFGKAGNRLFKYNTGIPLLISHPGIAPERRAGFVQHQDVFPTICAGMGIDVDGLPDIDGRNVLEKDAELPEKILVAWGKHISVRTKKWNMIRNAVDLSEPCQLYDVEQDPEENANIAEEHPDIVEKLTEFAESEAGTLPHQAAHTGDPRQVPPCAAYLR